MRLAAISAGAAVPTERFTGVVHSVFRQACNIRTGRDGLLTLLGSAARAMRRYGVRVGLPAGLAFSDRLRPGQRVGCRAAVLRVAGADFAVDLGAAERLAQRARVTLHRSGPSRRRLWPGKRRGRRSRAIAGASASIR